MTTIQTLGVIDDAMFDHFSHAGDAIPSIEIAASDGVTTHIGTLAALTAVKGANGTITKVVKVRFPDGGVEYPGDHKPNWTLAVA